MWYNLYMNKVHRQKLIVGNWKMNTGSADAHILAQSIKNEAAHLEHVDLVLCPPSVWLGLIAENLIMPHNSSNLHLGAQNMHFAEQGAYTGEISPNMVKEVADYVILGHSERVHIFKEDVHLVAHKVKSAFEHHLTPILCVGEDQKDAKSNRLLANHLKQLVGQLTATEVEKLVVAYEPVWAIGTGNAATPEYAEETAFVLRGVVSDKTRILYGGSVDATNAKGFLQKEDIDGLLIGGASLKYKDFLTIAKYADDEVIKLARIRK